MSEQFGLVKNQTGVPFKFGAWEVPPHAIGRVPLVVIHNLRAHPLAELTVCDDNAALAPFVRTPHVPFGPRYPGPQESP